MNPKSENAGNPWESGGLSMLVGGDAPPGGSSLHTPDPALLPPLAEDLWPALRTGFPWPGLSFGGGPVSGDASAVLPGMELRAGTSDTLLAAASPVTLVFQEGLNGYAGTLDTTLDQASPSTSLGSATSVTTDKADSGKTNEKQGLLVFDSLFGSGPGQIPVGATITSATLTFQTTNASGSASNGSFYRMIADWSESSTWSSMTSGIQTDGVEARSVADVTVGPAALGTTVVDVTASLQAWASAGLTAADLNAANQGWLIKTGSTDAWGFDSSEGSIRPKLTVTYVTDSGSTDPVLSVADATQTEGPGASMTFRFTLSQAATTDVSVSYSLLDGTATAANDYSGASAGSFTIAAGQTSYDLLVALRDDLVAESTETFSLQVTAVTGALTGDGTAVGTILDNDKSSTGQTAVVAVTTLTAGAYKLADASGYGSSDPSGLAYVPSLQKLFIADSEHDERPFYSNTNMFSIDAGGGVSGYSLRSFTREPTGLGYNSTNGYLYIADDDQQEIFWVDPAKPSVKLGSFDTAKFGLKDTEDLKCDPITGDLYVLDGSLKKLFEFSATGQLVKSTSLPSVMKDAEALAYDPSQGAFYVASGASTTIWKLDHNLNILSTITLLSASDYRNPVNGAAPAIKGLELAPSSNPDDGATLSLYAADYGVDQVNDGRLFEISLGPDLLV